MKLKHDRDILDITQLVITILTAVFALRLNYLQGELSRRIQREGITQTYAEKILGHLDKLKLDVEQRGTVVIDMLDIITEANLNVGERPYSDLERQQLIPLRLALATHDADLIAHIGTSKHKRKLWTNTAIESGNDEIKRTAIRALAQIGRYRGRDSELETFSFCVEKILDISEDFSRGPISDHAQQEFAVLVQVAAKVPSLLDDEPLQALMRRGKDALILVAGRAIQKGAEQRQIQLPEPPPTKPMTLDTQADEVVGLQAVVYRVDDSALTTHRATGSSGGSGTFLLASWISKATENALKQVNDLNLKKGVVKQSSPKASDISSNISALKSDDVATRRNARLELAKGGAASVPLLLAALRKEQENYRMRVGVTLIFSRMNEPVSITESGDAKLLVQLAGDEDPEVRQYASEFLMRLSDSESLKTVFPELKATIAQGRAAKPPNGNAVFNAVVILGTWMRTLPSELAAEKSAIAQYLGELRPEFSKDNNWGKTLALIDELNEIASEDKPRQN